MEINLEHQASFSLKEESQARILTIRTGKIKTMRVLKIKTIM